MKDSDLLIIAIGINLDKFFEFDLNVIIECLNDIENDKFKKIIIEKYVEKKLKKEIEKTKFDSAIFFCRNFNFRKKRVSVCPIFSVCPILA